eukprot:m.41383 g.41383  ORF g.41383 m.41383 type:complete len:743 (-) comp18794_c0_seq1:53-2281(-)
MAEPEHLSKQDEEQDEDLALIENPVDDKDAEIALALLEKEETTEEADAGKIEVKISTPDTLSVTESADDVAAEDDEKDGDGGDAPNPSEDLTSTSAQENTSVITVAFDEPAAVDEMKPETDARNEETEDIEPSESPQPVPHVEEPGDLPQSPTPTPLTHVDVIIEVTDANSNTVSTKMIKVEVEQPQQRKPWLGGFRSQTNGIEYHNASSQTYIRTRPDDGKVKYHREVQTKATSSGTTNDQMTVVESSTQMTSTGVFVTSDQDIIVTPRPYITAAHREAERLSAVIVLQKYVRRMRAIKYVDVLRKKKAVYAAWVIAEKERKQREEEAEYQSRIDRRTNPRTKDDFQLLYHGLEVWRQEQLETLTGLDGAARSESLVALLQQQCHYLSAIDKLKIKADSTNRDSRIKNFFDKAAAPQQWVEQMYNKVNSLETPDTLRARELREVYYALNLQGLQMDERLDILLHVKLTVQEFDTKLAKEIAELLNREADLLLRGADEANLVGLRKRIMNLFLRFCEDPLYNPIAAKYLPEHRDKDDYKMGMFVDVGSTSYASTKSFVIRSPGKKPTQNQKAIKTQTIAVSRKDVTQHHRIMEDIRRKEIAKGYSSQVVFLMSVEDMTYIIETIWGAQSCLSQESEIFRLTLARWDEAQEWSPWNCVLLTKDEAETHEELHKLNSSLQEMYGVALCRAVTQKHLRARCYFLSLVDAQSKGVMKQTEEEEEEEKQEVTLMSTMTANNTAITSS